MLCEWNVSSQCNALTEVTRLHHLAVQVYDNLIVYCRTVIFI